MRRRCQLPLLVLVLLYQITIAFTAVRTVQQPYHMTELPQRESRRENGGCKKTSNTSTGGSKGYGTDTLMLNDDYCCPFRVQYHVQVTRRRRMTS